MGGICCLGKRNGSKLKNIADAELSGGYAILLCHLHNRRIFQRLAVGNGRVCLHLNALRFTEVHQCQIGVADVQEDLIDHGLYAARTEQVFKIVFQKIGHANDLNLACRLCIFQRTPDLFVFFIISLLHSKLVPRLGRMNDHLVKVVKPHLFQRFINGLCRILVGFQFCRDLAGNEQRFPVNAAGAHALADTALISISLCGVDQAIAQLDRRTNGFRCLSIINKPGAQSQLGNLNAVCQRVSFIQNHCFSSSIQMSFAMRKTAHALGQPQ